MSFTLLDAGLGVVFLLFLMRGLLRGMMRELAGLFSIILAFLLAGKLYPRLTPHVREYINSTDTAMAIAYAAIFVGVIILVALFAMGIRKFISFTLTPWLDHLLGGVVGAIKGLLLCAVALAVMEHLVPESPFLQEAALTGYLERVTDFVRGFLPAFL